MQDGEDEEGTDLTSVILTPRLLLRPGEARDGAAIAMLSANPRVAENLAAAPGLGSGESFVVVERASGVVLGVAGYGPMAERPQSVAVATWLGEPHWGRGYATEATQAVVDRAFRDDSLMVLWCSNRASNARARRVIEKCGFQFRESGMMRVSAVRGAVPVERFVLERRNWTSLKAWGAVAVVRKERDAPPRNHAA